MQRAYDLPGRRPVLLASLGYAFAAAKRIEEGDHDQAFEWLEKGFEEHAALLVTLKVDPVFDPLRGDPRFTDLIRRMRLAD
jgi:hypothetical protein